jgi:HlyD family secretion protein
MNYRKLLIIVIATTLLAACSQATPPPPVATPEAAASAVPTSSISGVGGFEGVATSEPTVEPTPAPVKTYTVRRDTIEDIVTIAGQIAPVQNTMSFTQDGVITEVYVQPGQMINKGDLVAELDLGDLSSQLRQAQLTAQQDQASFDRAAQASQLAVQQAELDLEAARQDLEEARQPAKPVDIAQAQTDVRQSQNNLDKVRNDASQAKNQAKQTMEEAIRNLQALQDQHALAKSQLDKAKDDQAKALQDEIKNLEAQIRAAEIAVQRAVIDYDTARNNEVALVKEAEAIVELSQARLDALLRGPDPYDVAEKEREVRRAQLGVTQARQGSAPDPALVRSVQSGQLAIAEIEEQIAKRRLYAPFSGEVAVINANLGQPVQPGEAVVTLVDLMALEIVADTGVDTGREFPPRLSNGQPVEIRFSRYPNETFSGTVSQAPGNISVDPNASTVFRVSFDGQGKELSIGDGADLRIVLGRKYDALWLPPEAVRTTRDRTFVTMRIDGDERRVDIATGIITADKVEILSGLQEGDEVIVQQ